ncbi:MAG: ABC transporter substrate-binding protein [Cellulomonadaceae bacterium]|jgi:putative ABC transport system substrate-binding protein|nr:ABC transporter substrate-binding protein [Cellulomonadaceae bacterium]
MSLKRTLAGVAAAALALTLAACAGTSSNEADSAISGTDEYTIGVAVIVAHPALQAAQDGFVAVLEEEGIPFKLVEQNAQGDAANAATIASGFAANEDLDLILAISTPIATAIAAAEHERPILFTAVTDPVDAGLVPSWDEAGPNISGTSDLNPGAKPIGLIQEAIPNVGTVGVLYNSSEANSLPQVAAFQEEAATLGVNVKAQAITSAAEITAGLEALKGVDAILVPTDNTVVAALATVIGFGQENQIPVFTADASSVEDGTVATRGLSYLDLGRATGQMAVEILRDGTPVSSITPQAPDSTDLFINIQAAESFGLTLPQSLIDDAAEIFGQ